MSMVRPCFAAAAALAATALLGLWLYAGPFGLNVMLRHGGTWWVTVDADSLWLSPAMRLALRDAPIAEPGGVAWRAAETGFEVVDGSYSDRHGRVATPLIGDGVLQGPGDYDAKAGAFINRREAVDMLDLRATDYRTALSGASDAMVSFPLLIADGQTHVEHPSRWLANRSFVGQDRAGRIGIGTTDQDCKRPLPQRRTSTTVGPLSTSLAENGLSGFPAQLIESRQAANRYVPPQPSSLSAMATR